MCICVVQGASSKDGPAGVRLAGGQGGCRLPREGGVELDPPGRQGLGRTGSFQVGGQRKQRPRGVILQASVSVSYL